MLFSWFARVTGAGLPSPPPRSGAIVDNEGGLKNGTTRPSAFTKQGNIEYVPSQTFEERFDDPSNHEPTESHKGIGSIFLCFSLFVVFCTATCIEVIHGGNLWGLSKLFGFDDAFPVTWKAPQYIPPRSCGDTNGDHTPDEALFNCTATAIAGVSGSSTGGDLTTWAVVSPRNEIMCTPPGSTCQPAQCCVDLGPDCAPQSLAPEAVTTAWELGDGGCASSHAVSMQCAEVRMPNTETASACRDLVVQANEDFEAGRSPMLYGGELSYPNPNTWPPTVRGQQMSITRANGVSWGRGSPKVCERTCIPHTLQAVAASLPVSLTYSNLCRCQDPDRIVLSLADTDINNPSYKQCWAEFGMTEAIKNYFDNDQRLVDMTDLYQTCRLF